MKIAYLSHEKKKIIVPRLSIVAFLAERTQSERSQK